MNTQRIGARPGTLFVDQSALSSIVRIYSYDQQSFTDTPEASIEQIRAERRPGRKLWVDVQGVGDEKLLLALADEFSIHPLALEDVAHFPVRPKCEPYADNLLVVTRMLSGADSAQLDVEQVSLLIGEDYVLTIQQHYGDTLDPVRRRLEAAGSRIRNKGSDYLGYAIADTIIDAYYPSVERLGDEIEELEEKVLTEATTDTLRELSRIKRQLQALRRAVSPQREALNSWIRDENSLISDSVRIYLRDSYDHIVQTSEAIESARELVNGLMNTYLSVASNRMNEVMKVLTIVASIFVPLTFMAGIYGMNFTHMPELGWRWGYPTLLILMGLTTAGMLGFFWRKGWIGRGR
jgi:magnesium transporter